MDKIEEEFTFRYLNLFNLFFALKKMALSQEENIEKAETLLEEVEGQFTNTIKLMCYKLYQSNSANYRDCSKLINETLEYNKNATRKGTKVSSMIKVVWKAFKINFENINFKNEQEKMHQPGADMKTPTRANSSSGFKEVRQATKVQSQVPKIVLVGDMGQKIREQAISKVVASTPSPNERYVIKSSNLQVSPSIETNRGIEPKKAQNMNPDLSPTVRRTPLSQI